MIKIVINQALVGNLFTEIQQQISDWVSWGEEGFVGVFNIERLVLECFDKLEARGC